MDKAQSDNLIGVRVYEDRTWSGMATPRQPTPNTTWAGSRRDQVEGSLSVT